MSDISKIIGTRIRNYRKSRGLSQETLAELAKCHPTYIGQIERGEKNATVDSIFRITTALKIPMSALFEKIGDGNTEEIPLAVYEIAAAKSPEEQKRFFELLKEIENYKNM